MNPRMNMSKKTIMLEARQMKNKLIPGIQET